MFASYYRHPKRSFRRNCTHRYYHGGCTYASLLAASRSNGITVETDNPSPAFEETGLLRYKKHWEHKEAEVFVKHHALTGIPVFTPPDTLRIISGGHSSIVPLEQVACIRIVN